MSELLNWMGNHWALTWCALWLMWGVIYLLIIAVEYLFRLVNRVLRTVKVLFRGWPPEHIEADGDFRPQPKPLNEGDE